MNPERWRQIEEVYEAALKLEASERTAFINEACADQDVRDEVLSLVRSAADTESFLETPALVDLTSDSGPLAGHHFGEYQIVSLLGSGGMGEVYRARDPQHAREVAIKVLPLHLTWSAEAVARFEREARLLAALDQPHIAALYGVVEADGRRGLVLELVEGRTLAELIDGKPVPLDEALSIGEQIAEALECAHARNIIHRDLKPGNVKVTPAGVVKVLDFGLAKTWRGQEGGVDLSRVSMASSFATRDGVILGTPAYMSPEQARGKNVDKRTDLWAFGCVLFELLSGRGPFRGYDVVETVERIFRREPPWDALEPSTPAPLRRLLRRCLQKDVKRRLADIVEARAVLSALIQRTPGRPGLFTTLSRMAARWATLRRD